MANPGKSHDPAAAALSAIEEALNLSDPQESPEAPRTPPTQDSRRIEPKAEDRLTANPLLKTTDDKRRDRNGRPRLPDIDDKALFAAAQARSYRAFVRGQARRHPVCPARQR